MEIVTAVCSVLALVGTMIGCAFWLGRKISDLEATTKANCQKTDAVHKMVKNHSESCDDDRQRIDEALTDHGNRITALEGI